VALGKGVGSDARLTRLEPTPGRSAVRVLSQGAGAQRDADGIGLNPLCVESICKGVSATDGGRLDQDRTEPEGGDEVVLKVRREASSVPRDAKPTRREIVHENICLDI
jgi:hypothetical protein